MALFFNLENLEKEAGHDPVKFVALLNYHYKGNLPKSKYSKYKPSKLPLNGYSFILNPGPVFHLGNYDVNYVVQYIKLCALRDYAHYKFHGVRYLDTTFFPDLNIDKIKSNPLLKIANKQINFKYEDL